MIKDEFGNIFVKPITTTTFETKGFDVNDDCVIALTKQEYNDLLNGNIQFLPELNGITNIAPKPIFLV